MNDHHGRNSLLATYLHFQACVPQEGRGYGPGSHRPQSMPPQRKHNRSTSQSEAHSNVETMGLDAEISSCLSKGIDRTSSIRVGTDLSAPTRPGQNKLLHEEIALLWAMPTNTSRDVIFSNAWYEFCVTL